MAHDDDDLIRFEKKEADPDINDVDDGRVVFRYSREQRLSRAPASVRALYDETPPPKRGVFRILTSTKPLTFSFLSILTICAAIMLYSFLNGGSTRRIRDTEIGVQVLVSGEQSYITVKKTVKGKEPFTGEVNLLISASQAKNEETPPPVIQKLDFTAEKEETFRFTVPVTGKRFLIVAVVENSAVTFNVNPRR
jgi:hypothetical protein